MKISVVGSGYVGLVAAACFAELGNLVTSVDSNRTRISKLKRGGIPFHEPGLAELVARNGKAGRISFTSNLSRAATESEIIFIAVNTPIKLSGESDLTNVMDVAAEIGRHISGFCTVVNKSTAPVGTAERIRKVIERELARREINIDFDVISNPEFLKEGAAVQDFMRPDRVVVGTDSARGANLLRTLYAPLTRNHERLVVMGIRDAEMTKYAANAMLATRISFMNEIANLCEPLGVDIENVRLGIGADTRIGPSFIYAGCGYGGSCFPKDIRALMAHAKQFRISPRILRAVEQTNEKQKLRLYEIVKSRFRGRLEGKICSIWGLSFKPNTDDMREAPSLTLIRKLIEAGAKVRAFDPVAINAAKQAVSEAWLRSKALELVNDQYRVLKNADALILVTEWKPFRSPDFQSMLNLMRGRVIVDGRNQYDPRVISAAGFEYYGIGR